MVMTKDEIKPCDNWMAITVFLRVRADSSRYGEFLKSMRSWQGLDTSCRQADAIQSFGRKGTSMYSSMTYITLSEHHRKSSRIIGVHETHCAHPAEFVMNDIKLRLAGVGYSQHIGCACVCRFKAQDGALYSVEVSKAFFLMSAQS